MTVYRVPIDCEYKHVRESTVATVASIELCNALVESHFDLFQKNEMLMRTLKERFCPSSEETLRKSFSARRRRRISRKDEPFCKH